MLLSHMLTQIVQTGRLTVIYPSGRRHVFGPGGLPEVAIRLHDTPLLWKLALNPALYVGEAYMDGSLTIEEGSLREFLHICTFTDDRRLKQHPVQTALRWLARPLRVLRQYNPMWRARQNVAHHYDLSGALYLAYPVDSHTH